MTTPAVRIFLARHFKQRALHRLIPEALPAISAIIGTTPRSVGVAHFVKRATRTRLSGRERVDGGDPGRRSATFHRRRSRNAGRAQPRWWRSLPRRRQRGCPRAKMPPGGGTRLLAGDARARARRSNGAPEAALVGTDNARPRGTE